MILEPPTGWCGRKCKVILTWGRRPLGDLALGTGELWWSGNCWTGAYEAKVVKFVPEISGWFFNCPLSRFGTLGPGCLQYVFHLTNSRINERSFDCPASYAKRVSETLLWTIFPCHLGSIHSLLKTKLMEGWWNVKWIDMEAPQLSILQTANG